MVAGSVEENLRLVFETPERPRVDDPVPVALILRAKLWGILVVDPASTVRAKLCVRGKELPFPLFEFGSITRH